MRPDCTAIARMPVASDRSPESYEREIRSLEAALSKECANSYRLAQELAEVKVERDRLVAYFEHIDDDEGAS